MPGDFVYDNLSDGAIGLALDLRRMGVGLVADHRDVAAESDAVGLYPEGSAEFKKAVLRWHRRRLVRAALHPYRRIKLDKFRRLFVVDPDGKLTPEQWESLRQHAAEVFGLIYTGP